MYPVSLRLDPLPADRLSCCCHCSRKFQSPLTEHLSSSPLLPSESSCLLNCIPLLISPPNTEVEKKSGDPRFFHATFVPKYFIGCISHCCIVGGNHGIDVIVLIPHSNDWLEFPINRCLIVQATSGSLNFLRSNLSLGWSGFLAFFRRTRKVIITGSWSLPTSAPGKHLVLWMSTPDRKHFFTVI